MWVLGGRTENGRKNLLKGKEQGGRHGGHEEIAGGQGVGRDGKRNWGGEVEVVHKPLYGTY